MAGRGGLAERWRNLTVEQRLSVGVLCVAGLVAFVFSMVRIRSAIIRPFTSDVQTLVEIKRQLGPSDQQLAEQQQKADTDGDGLSDFDELNKYHTSAYLSDSDSDGIADNLEIAQGTDPNCAQGKSCFASGSATGTDATVLPGTTPVFGGGAPGSPRPTSGSNAQVPARDPQAIREYLRSTGMSQAQVAGFTDEQLLQAYDESQDSLSTGSSATGTPAQP